MGAGEVSAQAEREFTALFEAHYAELRRYLLRRVENRAAADDVLAETFAVAWRRRDAMPNPELPWLFGICHKVLANHRRAAKRRFRLLRRLHGSPSELGRDPAELLAEQSVIAQAFARLSEAQREVLRLAAWEGLDASEAAVVLGCSPGAFRVRLHRARKELSKHLLAAGHGPTESDSTSIERLRER